jgi:hypothetical protein
LAKFEAMRRASSFGQQFRGPRGRSTFDSQAFKNANKNVDQYAKIRSFAVEGVSLAVAILPIDLGSEGIAGR